MSPLNSPPPRLFKVIPQLEGWVELVLAVKHSDNAWDTKSLRLSPDEWASIGGRVP